MIDFRFAVYLLLFFSLPLAQAETLTGRVVRVTDGDTIVVLDASKAQHKIRLQGIDALERGQAFGTK
jgi:endonuclease YncB( thermonuclease family)